MRTLRSGKSLPEPPAVKRGSLNPQVSTKPLIERRASISCTQDKDTVIVPAATRRLSRSQDSQKKDLNETLSSKLVSKVPKDTLEEEKSEEIPALNNKVDESLNILEEDKVENMVEDAKSEEVKKLSAKTEEVTKTNDNVKEDIISVKAEEIKKSPRKRREPVIYDSPPTERLAKTEICGVCGQGFTRKAALLRHSQSHVVEVEPPPPPPKKKSTPVKHVTTNRRDSTNGCGTTIYCEVCNASFTRRAHLDRHMKLHTGERPFECDVCSLRFTRKDHMLSHRVKHNPEKVIRCNICKLQFDTMENLHEHASTQHPVEKSDPGSHICELCGKQFLQKRYLQAHRRLHMRKGDADRYLSQEDISMEIDIDGVEEEEISDEDVQEDSYESPDPPNTKRIVQTSPSKTQKPMVLINRVVKLSADLALKSRVRMDADNNDNFEDGDDIDLDYESMIKQLGAEENDQDDGNPSMECSVCGKVFTDKSTLRKHYKIHQRKFICRFCGLRLASAGSLMRHNLLHTGQKLYGCNLCERKFSRKDTLAVHLQAHEKSTTRANMTRPYLCRVCGASYTMKYNLIRHLQMCHSSSTTLNKRIRSTQPTLQSDQREDSQDKDMVISLNPFELQGVSQNEDENKDVYGLPHGFIKNEPMDYNEEDESQWESFNQGEQNEEDDEGSDTNEAGDRNYVCNHCGKRFKNSKSLNTHKWYHSREKSFSCPICNRGFKYSTDLSRHIQTHAMNSNKATQPQQVQQSHPQRSTVTAAQRAPQSRMQQQMPVRGRTINPMDTRPFGCKICPQRFNHRSNLSRHVRLLHNGGTSIKKRVPNSINLQNYLRKLQTHQEKPQIHMALDRMQQSARQGNTSTQSNIEESGQLLWSSWDGMNLPPDNNNSNDYDESGNLIEEEDDVTDKAKAIAAAQRPSRGSFENSIPEDSYTVDPDSSRPFSCNLCGKSFENRSNLWTHMRIHNKTFTCNFCGLKTATHGDLVLHLRTHTGERPYECTMCEWRFSRKSALNKHSRKYHNPGANILRPWKYREDRGNLKFKFVRSSGTQKNDFQMQHLKAQVNLTSSPAGKQLPRLIPNPNKIGDDNLSSSNPILKSALQEPTNKQMGGSRNQIQLENTSANSSNSRAQGGNTVFVCRRCGKVIQGKLNYIDHMQAHVKAEKSSGGISLIPSNGPNSSRNNAAENFQRSSELKIGKQFQDLAAKPFVCVQCGATFGQKAHLTRHQISHQNSEAARCDICGKICSSLGFLSRHYQYVHPDSFNPAEQARFRSSEGKIQQSQDDFDPMVPEVVMNENENASSNDDDDNNSNLEISDRPPNTRPNYEIPKKKNIKREAQNDSSREIDQEERTRKLLSSYNLARTGLDVTEVIPPCERCGKVFSNKKSRSDHVWYCKRDKLYQCPIKECAREFKLKHDVSRHINRHLSERRFSCTACPLKFFRKYELNQHLKNIHKMNVDSFPFPCDFCEQHFITEVKYNHHMRMAHGLESSDAEGFDPNEIQESNQEMNQQEYEDYDQIQNEEGYYYDGEDDGGPDPTSFLEQSMMSNEEYYECKLCKKIFPDRQKFMFHRYYHERDAKYACPDCDEKFKLRSHLERHVRTYHNSEKPVERILKCDQCPRKFTREHDLISHMNREHFLTEQRENSPNEFNNSNNASGSNPLSILKKTLVMNNNGEKVKINPGPSKSANSQFLPKKSIPAATVVSGALNSYQDYDDSYEDYMDQYNEEYMSEEGYPNDSLNESSPSKPPKEGGIEMGTDGKYHCDLCSKVFKEKKAADAHRYYHNREHKYICDNCGAKFKQNSDLQRHNRIHHNPHNRRKTIHCPHCQRSFTDDRYMRMHIRRYHSKAGQQRGLRNSIGSLEEGEVPQQIKTGKRPRMSRNDGKLSLNNETQEVDQMENGNESGTWISADGMIDFTEIQDDEESSIVIQSWGDAASGTDNNNSEYDDEEDITTIEELEYMNYKAEEERKASPDNRDKNNQNQKMNNVGSKGKTCAVLTCGTCGAAFESTSEISKHTCSKSLNILTENGKMIEENRNTNEASSTKSTVKSQPGVLKPFSCADCGKGFVQRADLHVHLQSVHNKTMEVWDCPFCERYFLVKKSLDSHKRRNHANIIQFYKCEKCGSNKFTTKFSLDTHSKSCAGSN